MAHQICAMRLPIRMLSSFRRHRYFPFSKKPILNGLAVLAAFLLVQFIGPFCDL
jgi:hypothetical protein